MVQLTARKTALVMLLACAFALAVAAPAFASGWIDWSVASTMPGNAGATSPHGGYTTATVKCKVCHAVHNADILGSELLLPSDVAGACIYCHVGGGGGYTAVYGGVEANYRGTDYDNAHNSFDVAGVEQGVTCNRCHQVHAASNQMTANDDLTEKLLKEFAVYDVPGAPLNADTKDTALTKWCAGCHFSLLPPLGGEHWADSYNMGSHVMTATAAAYDNSSATYAGQIAWKDSTQCMSCHADDYGVAGQWPHMTPGDYFLVEATSSVDATAPASNYESDGVCLRCHRNGSGAGIGETF